MDRELVLGIDFNNMLFGSYYGEPLINSNGINVNAIKGFFFKIKFLKDTFNPKHIVFANDLGRDKTFRRKLYKPYKDHRKPKDVDILIQLQEANSLISLLGYPMISNEEYEADDILGMISKFTYENDMDIILVSSDKDLYQLLNDRVFVFSPRGRELIDPEWLDSNYRLTPTQWIEFKMLMGDRSDNIPGIDGVGEVTSLRLMQQFGSIENVYKHLNQLKPALKEALIDGENKLQLIRDLITIVTDYKIINLEKKMLQTKARHVDAVYRTIERLEIPSLYNVMKYSLLVD